MVEKGSHWEKNGGMYGGKLRKSMAEAVAESLLTDGGKQQGQPPGEPRRLNRGAVPFLQSKHFVGIGDLEKTFRLQ